MANVRKGVKIKLNTKNVPAPKEKFLTKKRINHRSKRVTAYNLYNHYFGGGGAFEGAASSRMMRHWSTTSGTADYEILNDLQTLRDRSRDLYRNNSVARGAIGTMASNVIGSGLTLQSVLDRVYLGLDDKLADEWEENIERKFENWASSKDCDAARMLNFYGLQELAYLSKLQSGECFVLFPILIRNGRYQLCLQLIESDMVQNAPGQFNSKTMRDGIEVDEYGAPISYTIRLDYYNYKKVLAYGEQTGRPNIIHLFKLERPGQSRGIPFIASVIEEIKALGQYKKSELAATVISSMFTVFIKSNNENALQTPLDTELETDSNDSTEDDLDYTLAPGAVYHLDDNESVDLANPMRPNNSFGQFIDSNLRDIGMALGIPKEILVKEFVKSYSASRAARIEAYKFYMRDRNDFSRQFCQIIYEEWLTEEVLNNRVPAPGYIEDFDSRKAWQGSQWIGDSMGQIDEAKEVKAAEDRVRNQFSTSSQETMEMNGGNFFKNVSKQIREKKALLELRQIEAQIEQIENQITTPESSVGGVQ